MRHTRNVGQETTPAGVGIAMRMGERAGEFLQKHRALSRSIKGRGLVYFGHPSHQGRAIQTEQQFYQGLVSSKFVRKHKLGGTARQLRQITDVEKTPAGAEQYSRDVKGLIPSVKALLRGEPQPHYKEGIDSVEERIQVVKQIEKALHRQRLVGEKGKKRPPVAFVNFVSHSLDPYPGPSELIAEQLTGRKIEELGGVFKHAEGLRRVLYSDGTVETHVFRQDPRKKMKIASK